jgi:hypothetical protein
VFHLEVYLYKVRPFADGIPGLMSRMGGFMFLYQFAGDFSTLALPEITPPYGIFGRCQPVFMKSW